MSERGKNILERLFDTVPTLDKENQSYLVGLAEGMAIVRDSQRDNRLHDTESARA